MKPKVPPYVLHAREAINRALPELSEIQVLRLAATAELLAFGEDRGKWSLSADCSEDKERAQPYQMPRDVRKRKVGK
jgi:hypothetical protein